MPYKMITNDINIGSSKYPMTEKNKSLKIFCQRKDESEVLDNTLNMKEHEIIDLRI